MGFDLAGYLSKDRQLHPALALYMHPANRDSAHVFRMDGAKGQINLLVFKTRFDYGFASETSNTESLGLYSVDPEYPVFRFPQVKLAADLYRVHKVIKAEFSASRRAVLATPGGELAEFISGAEVVRNRMMAGGPQAKAGGRCIRFHTSWSDSARDSVDLAN
jgi:hypothetical protein